MMKSGTDIGGGLIVGDPVCLRTMRPYDECLKEVCRGWCEKPTAIVNVTVSSEPLEHVTKFGDGIGGTDGK